ncbi:unnamed protein product [Rangifer tarandus platyrhynchus]|uniref:Uncharacterized protein n=1 Tax=Rangifer tarandus platyrhynchus TaxID=3082113 RepID=A0ABN8Y7A4_RANTA|nr:unnamed protein product [Rangifer tarandus platyrhynchus]
MALPPSTSLPVVSTPTCCCRKGVNDRHGRIPVGACGQPWRASQGSVVHSTAQEAASLGRYYIRYCGVNPSTGAKVYLGALALACLLHRPPMRAERE